jgi:hypothetical protein
MAAKLTPPAPFILLTGAGSQLEEISLAQTVNEAGQLVELLRDLLGHFQR